MSDKDRLDLRFDIVRVAAAFLIVCLHVSADVVHGRADDIDFSWWVGNLYDSVTRFAIPLFAMLSGALILSMRSDLAPLQFYRRRASRILIPTIFWSLFYVGLRIARGDDLAEIAPTLVTGMPYYHLWFFYMVAGLYLVAPMISSFLAQSSRNLVILAIVMAFVMASIEFMVGIFERHTPYFTFIGIWTVLVPYFLAGHFIWQNPITALSGRLTLVLAFTGVLLVALIARLLVPHMGGQALIAAYSHLNPVVILMSLLLFNWFRRLSVENSAVRVVGTIAHRISPLTLGLYVIHPLFIAALGRIGLTGNLVNPLIGIPLMTAIVTVVSLIGARILLAIPFLRRTI